MLGKHLKMSKKARPSRWQQLNFDRTRKATRFSNRYVNKKQTRKTDTCVIRSIERAMFVQAIVLFVAEKNNKIKKQKKFKEENDEKEIVEGVEDISRTTNH
jgi:uncharacterized protein YaeQ